MTERHQEVALEGGERLDAAEQAALCAALAVLRDKRPGVRRAAVYLLGRNEAMVRVVVGRGWVPVMVERAHLRDAALLADRLLHAFGSSARSA